MKEIIVSVLISLVAALGVGSFLADQAKDELNTKLDAITEVLQSTDEVDLGAASSPDMPFRYLNVGGVKTFYNFTDRLTQATSSVVCSIQSPAGTSTLMSGGIQFSTATSGVSSLSISKSTTNATIGTIISSTTIASGAQASKVAATTTPATAAEVATAVTDRVFSPNTYFNVAQTGAGILNQTGKCYAVFEQF